MTFNSITFFAFFAIVLVLHNLPLSWGVKKFNLLIASYIFYAAWNPPFVILLWLSTLVDWKAAEWIYKEEREGRRRLYLAMSLVANLGVLGYFKYGGFLLENFTVLANAAGVAYRPPDWDIVLPVGISFYTFQTISYTLDVYLRRAPPTKRFLDFALFVTFFPHLVAGPIVRPTVLVPQFQTPRQATANQFFWGAALITLGMFEKVVLADGFLAPTSDLVFGATGSVHPLDAWTGVLAFSGQIFFDFSGYTTIAIGAALCMGFELPQNFNAPYAAVGFSDFWRRWHISLSTWLRDYLYIPLGGGRRGEARTYANLMITMLLGGLWHGAGWTFIVWGGLHGLYLSAERFLRGRLPDSPVYRTLGFKIAAALGTYALVNITWVFFRSPDFARAWEMLGSMFGVAGEGRRVLYLNDILPVAVIIGAMLVAHWRMRTTPLETMVARTPSWVLSPAWAVVLFCVVISQGSENAFIYFQF